LHQIRDQRETVILVRFLRTLINLLARCRRNPAEVSDLFQRNLTIRPNSGNRSGRPDAGALWRTIVLISLLFAWTDASQLYAQNATGYVVERIEVRGNRKTKADIILRSLPIHAGDRLTPGRLDASRESLYRTRLFRTVHVAPKPSTEHGKAVLVVYVDEKRFGDAGISFEYTELDGFGLAADAYHVNLAGEGKTVGVEYSHGERLQRFGFSYADPWLTSGCISLHAKAHFSRADRDMYRSSDPLKRGLYDVDRLGGAIGVGKPVGEKFRLVARYAFDEIRVNDFEKPKVFISGPEFTREISAALGRTPISSFGIELYRQPASRFWGSTPGFDFNFRMDFAPGALGDNPSYLRNRIEAYRHFATLPGQILSVGVRAGHIFGTPPFFDRFYFDGQNQLRGFERRAIGPEGGTEFVSIEGMYAIATRPIGRIYCFTEWAAIRRPVGNGHVRDSNGTYGIGALLFNRIDISYGLKRGTLIVKFHRFGGINMGL
jgi:outer membrane protein assembly factor BamA